MFRQIINKIFVRSAIILKRKLSILKLIYNQFQQGKIIEQIKQLKYWYIFLLP